jgi:hypothetical protein
MFLNRSLVDADRDKQPAMAEADDGGFRVIPDTRPILS